jgi:GMP synthase (glutamine-hydrolysing)
LHHLVTGGKVSRVKTVLLIQHEPFEGPGTLREALAHCERRVVRTYAGEAIPAVLEEDGLVVLGGGMGVYDAGRYPHLRKEMHLLGDATRAGRPVLGICLGSQLLAAALGGSVSKASRKEIGWYEVELLPAAREDRLLAPVPRSFTAFHWHGDAFTLPPDAVPLASSAMTPLQAFRAGARSWGIQFHFETDEQVLDAMLRSGREELAQAGVDAAALRDRAGRALPELRRVAVDVFSRWAALL